MKPAPFGYAAPRSLQEALDLLAATDGRALAGGQSLIPLINMRLERPSLLVDLNGVHELGGLRPDDDGLLIGAMTRQAELERSAVVSGGWPLLSEAVARVGHPATRSRGTIGGSVAHADSRAQLPVALAALDARFVLRSAGATRTVAAIDALDTGELLIGIRLPPAPEGARMAFTEYARTAGEWALAGAAVVAAPGHAKIALLGAGPAPVRASEAERAQVAGADVREVAALAAALAPDEYRRALIAVLVRRALERACS